MMNIFVSAAEIVKQSWDNEERAEFGESVHRVGSISVTS